MHDGNHRPYKDAADDQSGLESFSPTPLPVHCRSQLFVLSKHFLHIKIYLITQDKVGAATQLGGKRFGRNHILANRQSNKNLETIF